MSKAISHLRLRYGAAVFLQSMRQSAQKVGSETEIGLLSDYPPDHISALMIASGRVIASADSTNDENFEKWVEKNAQQ